MGNGAHGRLQYLPGHLVWVSSSLCPGHQLSSLVQLQRQPALLGQLTMVSHWVLEDVHLYQGKHNT